MNRSTAFFSITKGTNQFLFFRGCKALEIFSTILAGALFFCTPIFAEYKPDESISIATKNQPLSRVLEQLSQITGYIFVYDEEWANLNISVRVENHSLDKTLRRILRNNNFAIFYQENGTVRIRIYDDTGSDTLNEQTEVDGSAYRQKVIQSIDADTEDYPENSVPAQDETDTEVSSEEQDSVPDSEKENTDEDKHASEENHEPDMPGINQDSNTEQETTLN